jgi:hypothetical protein
VQRPGQRRHATVVVDRAGRDGAQRPGGEVGAQVPLAGSWRRLGAAAPAGPEPGRDGRVAPG